jgi:AraC-like DNA-binding protein
MVSDDVIDDLGPIDLAVEFPPGQTKSDPMTAAFARSTGIVERCEHFARLQRFDGVRLADLCRVGFASERRVRGAFHDVRGVAPLEWLRRLALDEVHEVLIRVEPTEASVTDVAVSHGFAHVSRFAAEYRHRFGENPSRTLRAVVPTTGS